MLLRPGPHAKPMPLSVITKALQAGEAAVQKKREVLRAKVLGMSLIDSPVLSDEPTVGLLGDSQTVCGTEADADASGDVDEEPALT